MNPALAEAIRANPFEGGGSDNVSVHNTTSVSAVDMKRTIKRVHLTCTKTLDEAKSAFSYHWRLYFELHPVAAQDFDEQSRTESIELHVTLLSKTNGMANTIAIGRTYETTRSTIAKTHWEIVGDEWTVSEMLTFVINDRKRHQFLFDVASGSGCADWCVTVLGDIEEAGKLSGGVKKAAEEFVDNTAREINDQRGMPLPTPKGTFYD
ncbi:hypothetical protein IEO21_10172 [Rhodonia placenta]|uniref:DUF7770 domain-containing protein n=1 Tax=Rhodonia placenta TaxID=104341 RepID=A0A8H7NT45_9APHY|nr:hypothetical protein IEO21_10172 [Postia placenta]